MAGQLKSMTTKDTQIKCKKYLGSNQSSEGFVTAIVSVLINTPTKII